MDDYNDEDELDEYPKNGCEHCTNGPCHFASRYRCIKTCIYDFDITPCPDPTQHYVSTYL